MSLKYLMCFCFLFYAVSVFAQETENCIKTFKISGIVSTGEKREFYFTVFKKDTDFTKDERKFQMEMEEDKYDNFGYIFIEKPSQQMDCAGYVLDKIWNTGNYWVGANNFTMSIIRNFAVEISNVTGLGTPRTGDIIVYEKNGTGNHIAYVRQVDSTIGFGTCIVMETKDNQESVYTHTLTESSLRDKKTLLKDPLIKKYGFPKIYRVDPKLISVAGVYQSECIEIQSAGGLNENWMGVWHKPGFKLTLSKKDEKIVMEYEQSRESEQYNETKDPRTFHNVFFNGEVLTGRWKSDPLFEDSFLNKTGKGTGTFVLKLVKGIDENNYMLEGFTIWDSDYCNGCTDSWKWQR